MAEVSFRDSLDEIEPSDSITQENDSMDLLQVTGDKLDQMVESLNTRSELDGTGDVKLTNADLTVATMMIGMQQARLEMAKGVLKVQEKLISKAGQALQQN